MPVASGRGFTIGEFHNFLGCHFLGDRIGHTTEQLPTNATPCRKIPMCCPYTGNTVCPCFLQSLLQFITFLSPCFIQQQLEDIMMGDRVSCFKDAHWYYKDTTDFQPRHCSWWDLHVYLTLCIISNHIEICIHKVHPINPIGSGLCILTLSLVFRTVFAMGWEGTAL